MELFAPPGYDGRKSPSSKQPNSFQKELNAKIKERKKLGLSTDITPSASEMDSDEDDNELFAHFKMTTKGDQRKTWKSPDLRKTPTERSSPASNRSKSPYDSRSGKSPSDKLFGRKTPNSITEEDDDDDFDDSFGGSSNLMMTMKKPMKPMDFMKTKEGKPISKSKNVSSLSKEDSKEKRWMPPSAKGDSDDEKENRPLRPKSPNVRGRKTPNLALDSIEEERPKPSPRITKSETSDVHSRPTPKPRVRSPRVDSEDEDKSTKSRQSPLASLFRKDRDSMKIDGRKTPTGRQTPSDDSPLDGIHNSGRKKTADGRKSPSDGRKTPSDGRKTPSDGRKSPSDGRKTPLDGRKTPSDGRKTPSDGRKTPEKGLFSHRNDGYKASLDGRQTPIEDERKVKKSSVLDMFSAGSSLDKPKPKSREKKKSLLAESDSDSDVGMGAKRESPVAKSRHVVNQRSPSLHGKRQQRRRDDSEDDDEIDGFRHIPSLKNKDRNSPHRRTDSPGDDSPWGGVQKPSLRRDIAVDEGDKYEHRRAHQKDTDSKERGRTPTRSSPPSRESSVCRDIDKDPTLKKQKEKSKEKKLEKAHTISGRMMEDAIVSVENAQDNTMVYINPDKVEENEKKDETKLQKIPKHKPKPRYAKPVVETTPRSNSTLSFNSTIDIRDAVYQEWYKERNQRLKKEIQEKKQKEKELEEKQKKEKEDKIIEAKASYNAWMENKKKILAQKAKEKKMIVEEKATKEGKESDKKKDAVLFFKTWKDEKDSLIREQQRKKKREEERKQEEEQDMKNKKNKNRESAFSGWKKNKDEKIKTIYIENKKTQKEKDEEEKRAKEEKEKEALESYNKWMEKKEKQLKRECQRPLEKEQGTKKQWLPASCTIPFGR